MILALDIGNSRSKWGIFEEGKLLSHGVLNDLREPPHALNQIARFGMASVGSPEAEALALKHLHDGGLPKALCPQKIESLKEACGVRNLYGAPKQLGVDRFAALVAARARSTAPTLVVMAGTACTVDALDAAGDFLGGIIFPGLSGMTDCLRASTEHIVSPDGQYRDFPKNTGDAIYSGALEASLGAITRQYDQLAKRTAAVPALLLTGGRGALLADLLGGSGWQATFIDTLVLEGIARLMDYPPRIL